MTDVELANNRCWSIIDCLRRSERYRSRRDTSSSVGKTIYIVTGMDVFLICGQDQLCAGLQSGIEGAIHAILKLFTDNHSTPSVCVVLLIDTSIAFNSLNSIATGLDVHKYWPCCVQIVLINTYRTLVLRVHSDFLFSKETRPFTNVCVCSRCITTDSFPKIGRVLDLNMVCSLC